ncbi:inositol-tetrakisphosphate 1-kinase 5-like [Zingiber officinale]|uniref:inositol-tetrakisphosphate 1-kinase 5-like n=1 Tax=Zingiber officinale TaxID=94328 RepID=UPI001C4D4AA6|nr:inositol-tetrakisphosphate 1-kinase 5-like [Zingiber officinale]
MAKNFPGRTDNKLKNFWNTRTRRRYRDSDQKRQQIDAQSPLRRSADLLEIPAFVTLCFLASGAQAFYARVFAGTFGSRMPDLLIVSTSFLHLGTDRKSLLRFRSGTEAGLRGLVFDLNLPPAEPSDRRFMVGYALLPKKQRSLIRPSLMSPARDRGVYLVPVDPWRPLAEQGHFNCVIHKLYAGEWMARLADFAAKSPGVPIVDHPLAIERLHNHDRIAMLHQVSKLNAPHGTETFGIPNQALLHDFSAGPSLG